MLKPYNPSIDIKYIFENDFYILYKKHFLQIVKRGDRTWNGSYNFFFFDSEPNQQEFIYIKRISRKLQYNRVEIYYIIKFSTTFICVNRNITKIIAQRPKKLTISSHWVQ